MSDLGLAVLIAAIPAGLFILGWTLVTETAAGKSRLAARLAHLEGSGLADPRDAELAKPLGERLIKPALERIGQGLARRLGPARMETLQNNLACAGYPGELTPGAFTALQLVGSVVLLLASLPLSVWLLPDPATRLALGFSAVLLGYVGPRFWLAHRAADRREAILDAMPNALDLLTISVEAGLGFDAAMQRVAAKYRTALSAELNHVLAEVNLGRPRREALMMMADRINIDELSGFVQAVVQSDKMGTSLAQTLRVQSEEMRRRRRQRAQEQGAKAPLKMLLPMVGCIFPTLFLVLLGPAALEIYRQMGH